MFKLFVPVCLALSFSACNTLRKSDSESSKSPLGTCEDIGMTDLGEVLDLGEDFKENCLRVMQCNVSLNSFEFDFASKGTSLWPHFQFAWFASSSYLPKAGILYSSYSKGGAEYEAGFRSFSATASVTPTGSKKAAEITKTEVMFSEIPSKAGDRISGYLNIYQDATAHKVNFSLNTSPCE
ncbi:MAG: hypothetical protein NT027_14520 [Proteobacteria bacterium]|nr:hypothetical protein [Pseudomonadota bacterium]